MSDQTTSNLSWEQLQTALLAKGMYEFDIEEVKKRIRENLLVEATKILVEMKGQEKATELMEKSLKMLVSEDLNQVKLDEELVKYFSAEEKKVFSGKVAEAYQKILAGIQEKLEKQH